MTEEKEWHPEDDVKITRKVPECTCNKVKKAGGFCLQCRISYVPDNSKENINKLIKVPVNEITKEIEKDLSKECNCRNKDIDKGFCPKHLIYFSRSGMMSIDANDVANSDIKEHYYMPDIFDNSTIETSALLSNLSHDLRSIDEEEYNEISAQTMKELRQLIIQKIKDITREL